MKSVVTAYVFIAVSWQMLFGFAYAQTREQEVRFRRASAVQALNTFIHGDLFFHAAETNLFEMLTNSPEKHRVFSVEAAKNGFLDLLPETVLRNATNIASLADSDGAFGMLEELKSRFQLRNPESSALLKEAQNRIIADLREAQQSRLLEAYRRARTDLKQRQVEAGIEHLKGPDILPTEEEIISALHAGGAKQNLVRRLRRALIGDKEDRLLEESLSALQAQADQVVADGISEYHRQGGMLDSIDVKSGTTAGIGSELIAAIEKSLDERQSSTVVPGKRYGVFLKHDRARAEEIAQIRLEKKLQVILASATREPSQGLKERIRAQIASQPTAHATLSLSVEAFSIARTEEFRSEVHKNYGESVIKVNSLYDTPAALEQLPAAVNKALNSLTGEFSLVLQNALAVSGTKLIEYLKTVRQEIAVGQAKSCCAPLVNREWTPTLDDLRNNNPLRLSNEQLRGLAIWQGQIPEEQSLLEETWVLLLESTKASLNTCQEALTAQEKLVLSTKGKMLQLIKNDTDHLQSAAHWRERYTEMVTVAWQGRKKENVFASAYPELFEPVRQQMRAIVAEAVQSEIIEIQQDITANRKPDIQSAIDQDTKGRRYAIFQPHYSAYINFVLKDWGLQALSVEYPSLHLQTETIIAGEVQKMVDAQHKLLQKFVEDAIAAAKADITNSRSAAQIRELAEEVKKHLNGPIPESDRDRVEFEKEDLIIIRQLKVVDVIKPKISSEIREQRIAGGQPDKDRVFESFMNRVDQGWRKEASGLGPTAEALRVSVKERIRGIIDLLFVQTADLIAQALKIQSQVVQKHEPEIRAAIESDQKNGKPIAALKSEYRRRLEDLVSADWKKRSEAKEQGLGNILPSVVDQIAGVIDKLVQTTELAAETEKRSKIIAQAAPVSPASPQVAEPTRSPQNSTANVSEQRGATGAGEHGAGGAPASGAGTADRPGGGVGDGAGGDGDGDGSGGVGGGGSGGVSVGGPGALGGSGVEHGTEPFPTRAFTLPWLLLLLILLLILALLLLAWQWHRKTAKYPDFSRWGDPHETLTLLSQLQFALDSMPLFNPPHGVHEISEACVLAEEFVSQVNENWRLKVDAKSRPQLRKETELLLWGTVLSHFNSTKPTNSATEVVSVT